MLTCCNIVLLFVQGLLCGVLQVIIQKLSETDATKPGVLQFGDAIMEVRQLTLAPCCEYFSAHCAL